VSRVARSDMDGANGVDRRAFNEADQRGASARTLFYVSKGVTALSLGAMGVATTW